MANEKYRGSARFLKQLSSLQSGLIGRAADVVPGFVIDCVKLEDIGEVADWKIDWVFETIIPLEMLPLEI